MGLFVSLPKPQTTGLKIFFVARVPNKNRGRERDLRHYLDIGLRIADCGISFGHFLSPPWWRTVSWTIMPNPAKPEPN